MRRLMIKRKKKIREEKNVDENSEKEQWWECKKRTKMTIIE